MRHLILNTGGWIVLAIFGVLATLSYDSTVALVGVSIAGIACSIKGFGGCEMLLAMFVFTIVGVLLIPFTDWAWIAPFLPGGFMVSVALTDMFDARS